MLTQDNMEKLKSGESSIIKGRKVVLMIGLNRTHGQRQDDVKVVAGAGNKLRCD